MKNILCQVGLTTIIARFLMLDIPIDKDIPIIVGRSFINTLGSTINTITKTTSTFDGTCHQEFQIKTTKLIPEISTDERDDEEGYDTYEVLERNEKGVPIYKEDSSEETESDDPMDLALVRQDKLNPFRQLCIWKKIISFLGALPVELKKNEWMPAYCDNSRSKVEGDGKWHVRCSIVDPNGNEHRQGYQTTTTERRFRNFTS